MHWASCTAAVSLMVCACVGVWVRARVSLTAHGGMGAAQESSVRLLPADDWTPEGEALVSAVRSGGAAPAVPAPSADSHEGEGEGEGEGESEWVRAVFVLCRARRVCRVSWRRMPPASAPGCTPRSTPCMALRVAPC